MASDPSCCKCLDITQFFFDIDYLPARRLFKDNNRNILLRQHAVSVIAKVTKKYYPDAYVPYLAMNYFDRFLCYYDTTHVEGLTNTEKVCLIALSCYTLSVNMRTTSFLLRDLLIDLHRDVELNWISHYMVTTMQHRIKEKLNKKMKPVTAFWFLDHFYAHFKLLGLKLRSINEIIVQAQGEHTFVDFMPTEIAFSACVAAATIAHPLKELPEDINNMIRNDIIGYKVKEIVKKMIELCGRMSIEVAAEDIEAENRSLAKGDRKGNEAKNVEELQPQMERAISNIEPRKHMNFELKWETDVQPLEEDTDVPTLEEEIEHSQPRESTAISFRIPGTGKNINLGCCGCNIS
ncbi:hypothetical protein TSUD_214360 [Trifolium subterraneum]|uniref:B-like cyclin n=1 Tax=Trifolium subterraneum TaxID=3900 RepID=A0A2Z6NXK5_TRISU|nr:hypothetical protein TSUD_214360 [Trifolium subterraneum]